MALRKLNEAEAPRTFAGHRPNHRQWHFPRRRGRSFWCSEEITLEEYDRVAQLQVTQPVAVARSTRHGETYWWYKDKFYVEDDGYSSEEVQLLLWQREERHQRKLERLRKEMLSDRAMEEARRETVPEHVRILVWRRDQGKCVRCGSQQNLEYDHIIPVSQGGSNTARNIQLLCETCNRKKSDNI